MNLMLKSVLISIPVSLFGSFLGILVTVMVDHYFPGADGPSFVLASICGSYVTSVFYLYRFVLK